MRVLAYVEPHPIRGSYLQFEHAGRLFAQALSSAARSSGLEFRIFANVAVADAVASAHPEVAPRLLRPKAQEAALIRAYDRIWDDRAIDIWLDLVNGRGDVTTAYVKLLTRVHDEFPFEVVLLWSENGAVEQVVRTLDATPVHAELGPTRAPFPPTVYLDVGGTNGNATVTRVPSFVVERTRSLPRETWLTPGSRGASSILMQSGVLWPSAAELIPREPYVFIPLQLADDLNTLCHAAWRTPADFLEEVIPAFLERGLRVIVKGHPGVTGRPYNVTMEARALSKARMLGSGVQVLPREISQGDTLAVMTQAHAVCTINSSMGFEAMLLGKSCTLLGAAAYDVQGRIRQRGLHAAGSQEERDWDALLVSFLMGHYLLPLRDVGSGEALITAIRLIHDERRRGGQFQDAFWGEWVRHMQFGLRDLERGEDWAAVQSGPRNLDQEWAQVVDGELRFTEGGRVRLRMRSLGSTFDFSAVRVTAHFRGHIDEVDAKDGTLHVRGWAFDAHDRRPAVAVMVTNGEAVVACRPPSEHRPDVAEHLHDQAAQDSGFQIAFRMDVPRSSLRLWIVSERNIIHETALRAGPLSA